MYNNVNGVILVSITFLIVMYYRGKYTCNCNHHTDNCFRREILGIQYNHFYLFIFLGIAFPSYFWTFQLLGILFELFELILNKHEECTIKNLGGCLSEEPPNIQNSIYNFKVYKGTHEYTNPIDTFFNIKHSNVHFWHGSIAEVISNMIGFIIGIFINKYL